MSINCPKMIAGPTSQERCSPAGHPARKTIAVMQSISQSWEHID